jgi:hypothetical protein
LEDLQRRRKEMPTRDVDEREREREGERERERRVASTRAPQLTVSHVTAEESLSARHPRT